jgi:hypothetical protein
MLRGYKEAGLAALKRADNGPPLWRIIPRKAAGWGGGGVPGVSRG